MGGASDGRLINYDSTGMCCISGKGVNESE